MKKLKSIILFLFIFCISCGAFSQGIIVPSGTGAYGKMVYGGIGIISPQPYINRTDVVASLGVGLGDPIKGIGFEIGSSMLDLSSKDMYNAGVKIHRYLGKGVYAAIGFENLISFSSNFDKSDAASSQYLSFTQLLSQVSKSPFISRFSYSIGAGVGRFSKIGALDQLKNKDRKGTYGFGAIACKLTDQVSAHVEWSGTNLNSGFSVNGKLFKIPFSFMFAASDLTDYTSDRIRFIGGIGTVYKFNSKPSEKELLLDNILENQEKEMLSKLLEYNSEDQIDSIKKLNDKLKQLQTTIEECSKSTNVIQEKLNKCNANSSNGLNNGYNNNDRVENHQGENVTKYDPKSKVNSDVIAGYYVVIHTFKYENQAVRAAELENKTNIKAQILNNKTRKLYYVYTEYFKNLKDAVTKSIEEREKGHVGTWVHIY